MVSQEYLSDSLTFLPPDVPWTFDIRSLFECHGESCALDEGLF